MEIHEFSLGFLYIRSCSAQPGKLNKKTDPGVLPKNNDISQFCTAPIIQAQPAAGKANVFAVFTYIKYAYKQINSL
jgi:hypothetical protein